MPSLAAHCLIARISPHPVMPPGLRRRASIEVCMRENVAVVPYYTCEDDVVTLECLQNGLCKSFMFHSLVLRIEKTSKTMY
eukprot:2458718-Amphidinium_carterae.2